MSDRTDEIRKLWESTPKSALEAALSGNHEEITRKALECMSWVTDFQLKYKDEFAPLDGLAGIVGDEK